MFLLYWIQKGMLFLKYVLQDVIFLSIFLNAPQQILRYLWVQQKTFWVGLVLGVKSCVHFTSPDLDFHTAVLDIATVFTFSRSYLQCYFCLHLGSFISINNCIFIYYFPVHSFRPQGLGQYSFGYSLLKQLINILHINFFNNTDIPQ